MEKIESIGTPDVKDRSRTFSLTTHVRFFSNLIRMGQPQIKLEKISSEKKATVLLRPALPELQKDWARALGELFIIILKILFLALDLLT